MIVPVLGAGRSMEFVDFDVHAFFGANEPKFRERALRLAEIAERTKPQRCMAGLTSPCEERPIRGHFIQKGLLKKVSRKLVQFYSVPQAREDAQKLYDWPIPPWEVNTKEAARWEFLCEEHEQYFWEMENPKPKWDDPVQRTKLAYRALLASDYMKRWMFNVSAGLEEYDSARKHRQQWESATPLRRAIRNALIKDDYQELRHVVVPIDRSPSVAAAGVIIDPVMNMMYYNAQDEYTPSFSYVPVTLTLLPDDNRQMLLLTYLGNHALDIQKFLNTIGFAGNSVDPAELSKKILDEMEYIDVSHKVWQSFEEKKQDDIIRHFMLSMVASPLDFDTPASQLDLFKEKTKPTKTVRSPRPLGEG